MYDTLYSFSIKNIFYDKMDFRFFYFRVTNCSLKLNIPFIYFMTLVSFYIHSKHEKTSDVFRVYRKRPVSWNGLIDAVVCFRDIFLVSIYVPIYH